MDARYRRSVPLVAVAAVACLVVASPSGGNDPGASLPRSGAADEPDPATQRLRNRGKALYEEKRFADAAEVFAAVVEGPGATARDWLNLALARYESNADDAALEAAATALELEPRLTGGFYVRAMVHRRSGRLEAAREALERARELDPTAPSVRYNLGAVHAQLGDEEAARDEYETVMAMGFDVGRQHYVSSLYRHFQLLLKAGEREAAAPEIQRYQETRQRLSQAARAPTALERGRYTEVVIPTVSLEGARPETGERVGFARRVALSSGGSAAGAVVGDVDGDGRGDVVVPGPGGGVWLWRPGSPERHDLEAPAGPAALGDFDRDGRPDLYVASAEGDRLWRNVAVDGGVRFEPVPSELPGGGAPTGVEWVDFDHDGDLDVLITHGEAKGEPVPDRLLRNLGGGAFEAAAEEVGIAVPEASRGARWADFDGDNDVDLYVLRRDGSAALYSNARSEGFVEVAGAVGAAGPDGVPDAVAEDLDNDGDIDLALLAAGRIVLLANSGDGTFREAGEVDAVGFRLLAADWNNDGWLDLAVAGEDGTDLLVNAGELRFRTPRSGGRNGVPSGVVAARDADADGAVDLLVDGADGAAWRLQPGPVGSWLKVELVGIKNNVQGIGSTVEIKGDGHYQLRPVRSSSLHLGTGDLAAVDVLRITWPNGIVQNLLDVEAAQELVAEEVERLEGSCPFLYTWDGTGWRFVNEVLGVAPLGMPLARGVVHPPDADEYVPVDGEDLRPRGDELEIRFTEELREVGYLDAARLIAVDRPRGIETLPDERFTAPPHPEFRLHRFRDARPVTAVDQRGRDWSEELAAVDRDWAVPFRPGLYDGLATPHALVLELPEAAGTGATPVRLLLTGWVYWATGSINLAVDQDPRVEFTPVTLEIPDGNGGWRVAVEDIGLPNAKNSTLIVDLTEHLDRRDPRVRLRTTMRLYWDAARYVVGGADPGGLRPRGDWQGRHGVPRPGPLTLVGADGRPVDDVRLRVLAPRAAELRFRGFSRLRRTAEGFETFDYDAVRSTAPWNQHPGSYTRYGDVSDHLVRADDRYVVLGTGDEVAIRFPADLPPLPEGWERDWLVYLNGWVKDGDPNTLHGDRVEPLPFHGMNGYPYGADEGYPDDPAHRRFLERTLTRPARAINPPLAPAFRAAGEPGGVTAAGASGTPAAREDDGG